tara:strand:+ start:304 stop:624 length:321 start_codon:yes stop_codon:yes gene_type:complete
MIVQKLPQKDLQILIKRAKVAANCLKALSHETRLLIVCYISNGEKNVQELAELLSTTQSNISQHLAKLRDKEIVDTRKEGNQVFYRIKNPGMLSIMEALCRVYGYK